MEGRILMITQQPGSEQNKYQKGKANLKYGMFIHFGVNTFADKEWTDGTIPATAFNPVSVDADQWVKTAYEAGMKFLVLVTKHHDGFCLWNSAYTTYDVESAPNKTDVVMAVSLACQKYGVRLGLYYSLWDRGEPSYLSDFSNGYIPYMKNQLTELMTNYGHLSELWFDGGWEKTSADWKLDELYDLVKKLQPQCQIGVNGTIGRPDKAGLLWMLWKRPKLQKNGDTMRFFPSDFRLADPSIPKRKDPKLFTHEGKTYYLPFEATQCLKPTWFYNTKNEGSKTRSVLKIAKAYKQLVSQENTYVLNAAPNREGKLMQSDIDTLYAAARVLGIAKGGAK